MTLLPLLFLSSPAFAAPPNLTTVPRWTWAAGTPTRWHLETQIFTPHMLGLSSVDEKGVFSKANARLTNLVIDTECTPAALGKNTLLTCTFSYVDFKGEPAALPADDKLPEIYAEWSKKLAQGRVELVMDSHGRIKAFDLQGMHRVNTQSAEVIEMQRVVLQRAFCLFELPLPDTTDDFKRGWKQTSTSALMQLTTTSGTGGAYDMQFTAGPVSDDLLPIELYGRGTLSYGSALDATTGSRLVSTTLTSLAEFDLKLGLPVWRNATLDGRLTSASASAGSDAEFYQVSVIQKVDAFLPNGEAPISLMASRAPKRDLPPPEITAGLELVPFATLGMDPLFVPTMPLSGKQLGLPTTIMTSRLEVADDGHVTAASTYKGYEALAGACELALRGAMFKSLGKAYAVDVDVEFRKEATP